MQFLAVVLLLTLSSRAFGREAKPQIYASWIDEKGRRTILHLVDEEQLQRLGKKNGLLYYRNPLSHETKLEGSARAARRPKPEGLPAAGRSHIRGQRLEIVGQISAPRAEFSRSVLQIERADEPLRLDYIEKIRNNPDL